MDEGFKTRFTVLLNKIEHLPAVMTIMQLLRNTDLANAVSNTSLGIDAKSETSHDLKDGHDHLPAPQQQQQQQRSNFIDALRLLEFSDRTSAVMRSSEADEIMRRDPLISVFTTFGRLLNLPVSSTLSIVSQEAQSSVVAAHLRNKGSQMVIIPWQAGSSTASMEEPANTNSGTSAAYNPFQELFGRVASDRNMLHENFVRRIFAESPADVALFIDRGGAAGAGRQHLFLPFFGGPDDRLTLRFVVQLCSNSNISATVVRVKREAASVGSEKSESRAIIANEDGGRDKVSLQVPLTVVCVIITPPFPSCLTRFYFFYRLPCSRTRYMPVKPPKFALLRTPPTTFYGLNTLVMTLLQDLSFHPTSDRPFLAWTLLKFLHPPHFGLLSSEREV